MSVSRVIEVSFGNETVVYVNIDTAYYYNDGVIIKPTDGDLPDTYQVHWADSPEAQTTLETIGTSEGVPVPDELWGRSKVIYGWFYLHPTEDSSVTYKEIRIYKSARAGLPDGTEPTPSEHSTIDQLISAMNTAADKAEQNAGSASSDADRAETARSEAESYATNAQTSASNAEASATTATNQAQIATTSATTATTAAQTATTKATEASNSASSAAESASSASNSADSASRSEQAAKISETNAADSESNASTYANSARGYAQTAQSASASASSSATSASNSATSASNSATSASQSASIATEAKADIEGMLNDVEEYANSASLSATASANSATTAQGYANSASASAQSASTSASNASASANTASTKASEASTSAQTASTKATEASQSASQALSYKTDAESAKTASQTAQGLAESARDTAVSAKDDAESARDDAVQAKEDAESAVASISGALDDKAPVITDTASGAIASFTDGADDLPLKSLVVDINPIQDLHGQDAPYPAGGGKNILPYASKDTDSKNGVTWTKNSDGSITFSGTCSASAAMTFVEFKLPAGDYLFSNVDSTFAYTGGNRPAVYIRDLDNALSLASIGFGQSANGVSFSLSAETNIRFYAVFQTDNVVSGVLYPMIRLSTVTDATYAPYENICPISGWTSVNVEQSGVNVWDEEWEVGGYNINTGDKTANNLFIRCKNPISVVSGQMYHVICPANMFAIGKDKDGNCRGLLKSTTGVTNLANKDILIPPSVVAVCWYSDNYGTTYNHDISINYPSTDHDYHPYTGRSITINLGQTVYGGKLDVLSGELVIDRAMVDLGTLNWAYSAARLWFYNYNIGIKSNTKNAMSSMYTYKSTPDITSDLTLDNVFTVNSTSVCIRNLAHADATEFKAAMSGVQLCYELAEPLTIQLTPNQINSLYGVNNLWADSGDTEVEYRADTKLFIERLTAPDSADMVADANITSGKYFMVGNSLYKATANIANGSAIVVGTNCIRKSLSEALNEINA